MDGTGGREGGNAISWLERTMTITGRSLVTPTRLHTNPVKYSAPFCPLPLLGWVTLLLVSSGALHWGLVITWDAEANRSEPEASLQP